MIFHRKVTQNQVAFFWCFIAISYYRIFSNFRGNEEKKVTLYNQFSLCNITLSNHMNMLAFILFFRFWDYNFARSI